MRTIRLSVSPLTLDRLRPIHVVVWMLSFSFLLLCIWFNFVMCGFPIIIKIFRKTNFCDNDLKMCKYSAIEKSPLIRYNIRMR